MEGVEERWDEHATGRTEQVADTVKELTVGEDHTDPQPACVPGKHSCTSRKESKVFQSSESQVEAKYSKQQNEKLSAAHL